MCRQRCLYFISQTVQFNEADLITSDGRYVTVHWQLLDTPVVICSIYAPSLDNPEFFHHLPHVLLELEIV